jgi:5-(carboxyamino)imidazole ribonucleotide synthase
MVKEKPILGIIGGGQLGSMLATAAKKLNIKTIVLSDDPESPAKNFCDEFLISDYNKVKNIEKFANKACEIKNNGFLFFFVFFWI